MNSRITRVFPFAVSAIVIDANQYALEVDVVVHARGPMVAELRAIEVIRGRGLGDTVMVEATRMDTTDSPWPPCEWFAAVKGGR